MSTPPSPRLFGLRSRFLAAMGAGLLLVAALVAALLWRQHVLQQAASTLGRDAVQQMARDTLTLRGNANVRQLADALANPLYFNDLDAIGNLVRAARQPDVGYVLVYDAQGRILHDGSIDIDAYGEPMRDALAPAVLASDQLLVQWLPDVMDVSQPISVGNQRLGGVRVGYSLAVVQANQDRAVASLQNRLTSIARNQLVWIVAMLLVLAVVALCMGWYVQRVLVAPIRQLAAAARAISHGEYVVSLPDNTRKDEVGDLVRAFNDMSDSIARHDRDVRLLAYTDALTGLTNRLAFREGLDNRLRLLRGTGHELALLFADIDDFKRVNDTLGHEAGDEVLVQFASRIRVAVQELGGNDALLARFGGDEFVILVQRAGEKTGNVRETAEDLAQRLVTELSRPLQVQGRELFLGTSVGITMFPEDAANGAALMKNGDIAMYQAKAAGKNCFRFYSHAMNQSVERRVQMEQELRGAWERGELHVVYQPIYDLRERTLCGAEALLRWKHPILGEVPPSLFVDVAEQSGLIESIGANVLRSACATASGWNAKRLRGAPLFVSVNLSPRQLRDQRLPEAVAEVLSDSGLAPSNLHLELTETAVIGDEASASKLLEGVRRLGAKVWLDDFGTGFSGLSYLRRVPVDGVKIDRSYVADIQHDPDDLALTAAIIAMAHSLGIITVAEGVENEEQFKLLLHSDCDLAQGYWLSQPLSAEEFARLV